MGEFKIILDNPDFICLYSKIEGEKHVGRLDFINQNSPLEYEFLLS